MFPLSCGCVVIVVESMSGRVLVGNDITVGAPWRSNVHCEREGRATLLLLTQTQKCKDLLNCSACFNMVGVVSGFWEMKVLPSVGCK